MFPHRPQSAEMLRRILVESSIKQEGDQTSERTVLDRQQAANVDGPVDEVSAAGRITVGGYSWNNVMLSMAAAFRHHDSMLTGPSALGMDSDSEVTHELALSPHDLEEDVHDEANQNEMLGLNIDHDSSSNYLLANFHRL